MTRKLCAHAATGAVPRPCRAAGIAGGRKPSSVGRNGHGTYAANVGSNAGQDPPRVSGPDQDLAVGARAGQPRAIWADRYRPHGVLVLMQGGDGLSCGSPGADGVVAARAGQPGAVGGDGY